MKKKLLEYLKCFAMSNIYILPFILFIYFGAVLTLLTQQDSYIGFFLGSIFLILIELIFWFWMMYKRYKQTILFQDFSRKDILSLYIFIKLLYISILVISLISTTDIELNVVVIFLFIFNFIVPTIYTAIVFFGVFNIPNNILPRCNILKLISYPFIVLGLLILLFNAYIFVLHTSYSKDLQILKDSVESNDTKHINNLMCRVSKNDLYFALNRMDKNKFLEDINFINHNIKIDYTHFLSSIIDITIRSECEDNYLVENVYYSHTDMECAKNKVIHMDANSTCTTDLMINMVGNMNLYSRHMLWVGDLLLELGINKYELLKKRKEKTESIMFHFGDELYLGKIFETFLNFHIYSPKDSKSFHIETRGKESRLVRKNMFIEPKRI